MDSKCHILVSLYAGHRLDHDRNERTCCSNPRAMKIPFQIADVDYGVIWWVNTDLLGSPSPGCAVVIEEKLSFPFVVDHIRIALRELLQFLLAEGDGKGAAIDPFHAEDGVRVNRCSVGGPLGNFY